MKSKLLTTLGFAGALIYGGQNALAEQAPTPVSYAAASTPSPTSALDSLLKGGHEFLESMQRPIEPTPEPNNPNYVSSGLEKSVRLKERFESFPKEIPGAKRVDKYETPGAKYCLVHVRNIHPLVSGSFLTQDQRAIASLYDKLFSRKQVQEEIYQILSYLVDNYALREVYQEGITPDKETSINEFFIKGSSWGHYLLSDPTEDMGSVGRMTAEKRIWIKPAEKKRLTALELLGTFGLPSLQSGRLRLKIDGSRFKKVLDEREGALLSMVSDGQNILPVTVYGAAHDWKNNIEEWNKKHSDKKASLIVVTPKSVDDDAENLFALINKLQATLPAKSQETIELPVEEYQRMQAEHYELQALKRSKKKEEKKK